MSGGSKEAPGAGLLRAWSAMEGVPGGSWFFSRVVGWMAPYSGTTGARVRQLSPGRCVVVLRERRKIRNHLDSVHAVALVNVGELATGLATLTALPAGVRGIVVGLEAEYEKKARGLIRAGCRTEVAAPGAGEDVEHRAVARLRDDSGDRVATVSATWRLSHSP